ncbi:hypothetical protein J5N97_024814 [Dioscorea zingiberensis]|uniref:Aminotransferase class I/classII large domain-containing protein n=1 Tax=Dioscorea zingiberensis TaxID=325984 RepID=A0A9D5C738_9LILI|nr:hypothetical protein J5N97_024814 [Dioscorea zingiberensis]
MLPWPSSAPPSATTIDAARKDPLASNINPQQLAVCATSTSTFAPATTLTSSLAAAISTSTPTTMQCIKTLVEPSDRRKVLHRHRLLQLAGINFPFCNKLRQHLLSDNLDGALELFDEMRVRGVKPNVVTYSALVDGLSKGGRVIKVMEVVDKCRPNVITYSGLVDVLCREGRMPEAMEMLDRMRRMSRFRVGIVYSYNESMVRYGRRMSRFGLVSTQTQHLLAVMLSDDECMSKLMVENAKRLSKRQEKFT